MNVASMASITAIVELIAYAYKTKTSADNTMAMLYASTASQARAVSTIF